MVAGDGGIGHCKISIKVNDNAHALVSLAIENTEQSCRDLRPLAEEVAQQSPGGP